MPSMSTPAPEFVEIAERAKRVGVPVRDLLHETEIAPTTWWRWSAGKTDPSLRSIRALNDALAKREASHRRDETGRPA